MGPLRLRRPRRCGDRLGARLRHHVARRLRHPSNTAVVAATNEAQAQAGNNSDSDSVVVNGPDVSVVKTADQGTVSAGDPVAFTIVVSNAGPGSAYGVTLDDPLPAGISGRDHMDDPERRLLDRQRHPDLRPRHDQRGRQPHRDRVG